MPSENEAMTPLGVQAFVEIWAESLRAVLGPSTTGLSADPLPQAEAGPAFATATAEGLWFVYQLTPPVKGELGFLLAPETAVLLSQLLLGEPLDEAAPLSDQRREVLRERFQQFAAAAGTALRARTGQQVEVKLTTQARPAMPPAAQAGIRLRGGQIPPLALLLQLGVDLTSSLSRSGAEAPGRGAATGRSAPPPPHPAPEPEATPADANLDLLLDVQVEATLRFGEQQLTLREVLELASGGVVELDRRINEPADLLVGGRLVARGEVVIVDGNYGLRVTEIVNPAQRLAFLEK